MIVLTRKGEEISAGSIGNFEKCEFSNLTDEQYKFIDYIRQTAVIDEKIVELENRRKGCQKVIDTCNVVEIVVYASNVKETISREINNLYSEQRKILG